MQLFNSVMSTLNFTTLTANTRLERIEVSEKSHPHSLEPAKSRMTFLDLARGIAVALMILSHGVKGLLDFTQFEPWGLVPIHLITKFSSSLFIIVFGISLAVAYLPYVGTEKWPEKRTKLLVRGILILFWYKALTVVEMFAQSSPEQILGTLAYLNFPSYVEILGYYGLAFLWIPWMLPLWKNLNWFRQLSVILGLLTLSLVLRAADVFGEHKILEALINEHEDYYTWGQLSRAPLVASGLMIGMWLSKNYYFLLKRAMGAAGLMILAGLFFLGFYFSSVHSMYNSLLGIALNEGKHPPELDFMLFSISGALFILALALAGGSQLSRMLKPLTIIGQDALQAFIFHICVIFIFMRYLFGLKGNVSYEEALSLAVLLIFATAIWIRGRKWLLKKCS